MFQQLDHFTLVRRVKLIKNVFRKFRFNSVANPQREFRRVVCSHYGFGGQGISRIVGKLHYFLHYARDQIESMLKNTVNETANSKANAEMSIRAGQLIGFRRVSPAYFTVAFILVMW